MSTITRSRAHFVLGNLARFAMLATTTALVACGGSAEPEPGPEPEHVASRREKVGGIEGTFEYALDAPWRMEPHTTIFGGKAYTPIPLHVTVNDANEIADDKWVTAPTIGKVCQLDVTEGATTTAIPIAKFAEVERTLGAWTYPGTEQPNGPTREACTATTTADCAAYRGVTGTSEWHGLATYTALGGTPGADVALTLELKVSRSPSYDCTDTDPTHFYRMKNHVRVHYGEEALPRFGSGWAYGDLHYHSQGTDNEGESGYNYRSVSRAMQAIGLDFLWATEHASASEQIVDADITVNVNAVDSSQVEARVKRGVLRDMDARRFRAMSAIVKETNRQTALRSTGGPKGGFRPAPSQIFLGGEVDVIPETSNWDWTFGYGADKLYSLYSMCGSWHTDAGPASSSCDAGVFRCANTSVINGALDNDISSCDANQIPFMLSDGSWLIRDVQSLNEYDFGREHMVYLPDPAATDPFIASQTGVYGGARRRLVEDRRAMFQTYRGMLPEVVEKKGSVFLAHHNNAPTGSEAPDGPPWTESMLDKAWKSPAVLGLEFWNEDGRRTSTINPGRQTKETGYERDDTELFGQIHLHMVDRVRKGLAFGSDGKFELVPFDLTSGKYEKSTSSVESMLHDGAVSWDRLNMKGLDPAKTAGLTSWLPAGQPRRMFVAGGSDAHGDFNYRRAGYMEGTSEVIDMALGTPRNLVMTGPPAESVDPNAVPVYGASQVLAALRAGHFTVTDGPAMRIVVDTNENGIIDDTDAQMGDVLDVTEKTQLPVLVEWASTPEFGALARIELTVGALEGKTAQGRLYTGGWGTAPPSAITTHYDSADGLTRYSRSVRDYWYVSDITPPNPEPQQTERLTMLSANFPESADPSLYMKGVRRFVLDLSRLPVAVDGTRPNRIFVRALGVGRTAASTTTECADATSDAARSGRCIRRYALTNPVWVRNNPRVTLPPGDFGTLF